MMSSIPRVPAADVIVFEGSYQRHGRERDETLQRWRHGESRNITVWREMMPAGPFDVPDGELTPRDVVWDSPPEPQRRSACESAPDTPPAA